MVKVTHIIVSIVIIGAAYYIGNIVSDKLAVNTGMK